MSSTPWWAFFGSNISGDDTWGVSYSQPPLLARSAAGELTYVASFADGHDVDRCWEDPEFQDLDARLSAVAEMIPARALHEASASYMDMEAVERTARSAELAAELTPPIKHAATDR